MMSGGLTFLRALAIPLACLLLMLGDGGARAQDCLDYSEQAIKIGTLNGAYPEFSRIAVMDSGLLVGTAADSTLTVCSLDTPATPRILGMISLGRRYSEMVCAGEHVYLGGYGIAGIRIIRVGPGGAISDFGSFNEQHTTTCFDADGSLLGMSLGDAWQLWECSNPSNPMLMAHVADRNNFGAISLDGDRAVVVDDAVGLRIYDIADHQHPVFLGGGSEGLSYVDPNMYYESASIMSVVISGDVVCMAKRYCIGSGLFTSCWHWLSILDVSDPTNMAYIGGSTFGQGGQINRAGSRIYASSYIPDRSMVLDTGSPGELSPKFVSAGGRSSAGFGEYLYLKNYEAGTDVWRMPPGMRTWQCLAPETGEAATMGISYYYVRQLAVADDYLAISLTHCWNDSHSSYEVSWTDIYDTASSYVTPAFRLTDVAQAMAFDGTRLYYTPNNAWVWRVDLSNPESVQNPLYMDFGYDCYSTAVVNPAVIAVGKGSGDLAFYGLSDLGATHLITSMPVQAGALAMDGSLLIALGSRIASVIDVSDPEAPFVRGQCAVDHYGSLTCLENRALISSESCQTVVDYAEPDAPFVAATTNYSAGGDYQPETYRVAVADGLVYLPGNGVHVLDLDDLSLRGCIASDHNILASVAWKGRIFSVGAEALMEIPIQCGALVPALLSSVDFALRDGVPVMSWTLSHPLGNELFLVEGCRADAIWAVTVRPLGDGSYEASDTTPSVAAPGEITYNLYEVEGNTRILLASERLDLPAPPQILRLSPVTPNPFNPRTTVVFELPRPQRADLSVYDAAGRLVRRLAAGDLPAGSHTAAWDGRDDRGGDAPSGAYFLRLSGESGSVSRKAVLLR